MRVRLVARLLAVTLASPVVAFTSPGEGLTHAEPDGVASSPTVVALYSPPAEMHATSTEPDVEPTRGRAVGDRQGVAPAEVRISVDCGHDGCVVQEGLAVLVVGDVPRTASRASHAIR